MLNYDRISAWIFVIIFMILTLSWINAVNLKHQISLIWLSWRVKLASTCWTQQFTREFTRKYADDPFLWWILILSWRVVTRTNRINTQTGWGWINSVTLKHQMSNLIAMMMMLIRMMTFHDNIPVNVNVEGDFSYDGISAWTFAITSWVHTKLISAVNFKHQMSLIWLSWPVTLASTCWTQQFTREFTRKYDDGSSLWLNLFLNICDHFHLLTVN